MNHTEEEHFEIIQLEDRQGRILSAWSIPIVPQYPMVFTVELKACFVCRLIHYLPYKYQQGKLLENVITCGKFSELYVYWH